MKAVRLTRNLVVVIALVVSLGANVTLFVGGVLYSFVDKFVEQAFDLATAAGKQRKALTALKTSSAKQAKALATWKAVTERQRGRAVHLESDWGTAESEVGGNQRSFCKAAKKVSRRENRLGAAGQGLERPENRFGETGQRPGVGNRKNPQRCRLGRERVSKASSQSGRSEHRHGTRESPALRWRGRHRRFHCVGNQRFL